MGNGSAIIEITENQQRRPAATGSDAATRRYSAGKRTDHRFDAAAIALLAAGLGLRVYAAIGTYLNPDEALHFLIGHQRTAWLAYRASLTNAHPPLIFLVLHFWQLLGRSEWFLRLPSVLAGTAFCWALYKWVGALFGWTAAMTALILAAFNPALIELSAQVRGYALLLLCLGGALYSFERAFETESLREMVVFSICLYLAILSHYSAVFCVLALGVYALARIAASRPPWKLIAAWAAGQLGAAAICAFLYFTHISKIQRAEMETWSAPHEDSLFHAGRSSLSAFTLKQTLGLFRYFFPENYLYQGLLIAFLLGVALILARGLFTREATRNAWPVGLLLLIPFGAIWAAAIAGVYPYSGSRQSAFLAPFVIAGISVSLVKLYGRKPWAVYVIAFLIAIAAQSSRAAYDPLAVNGNQAKGLMTGAVSYIRQTVPQGDPILADMQSGFVSAYYLCDPTEVVPVAAFGTDFTSYRCGGYSVVRDESNWKLTPANFVSRFRDMAVAYHLRPGQRVWVFQAGWFANLDTELSWFVMKYRCMSAKSFGDDITVIPFVVGPDLSPELPPGSPHLSRLGRCVNDPLEPSAADRSN